MGRRISPKGIVKNSNIYEGRVMASVSMLCRVQIPAPRHKTHKETSTDINELTIGQAKELSAMFSGKCAVTSVKDHPYTIGDTWFIRTVTHHLVGQIEAVGDMEIILKGGTVMWVADDGRFTQAIAEGKFNETEVYGDQPVVVGRGTIIDATRLRVKIIVVQK